MMAPSKSPTWKRDPTASLSVYGRTKVAGDEAIRAAGVPYLILRTSWVYGWRGQNFLLTMLRLSREREELRVVDDQRGAPTLVPLIAEATGQIVAQGRGRPTSLIEAASGVYHVTPRAKLPGMALRAHPRCGPEKIEQNGTRIVSDHDSRISHPGTPPGIFGA